MIIKFAKDSKNGACEYLQNGTKGDRNKKDKRVQLTFNDCSEIINKQIEQLKKQGKEYKDNYKHIILSFNEDEIDKATLRNIANDFVKMYMHAYNDEDYTYYAEAHIPKIKTNANGEKRHPHIHIFIPKFSFNLNRRLYFGTHPRRLPELEVIKELLIAKYDLKETEQRKIINKENYKQQRNYKQNAVKKEILDDLYYTLKNTNTIQTHKQLMQYLYKKYDLKYIKKSTAKAKTKYVTLIFKDGQKVRLRGDIFYRDYFNNALQQLKNNNNYIYNIYSINNIKNKEEYIHELKKKLEKRQQNFKQYIHKRFYAKNNKNTQNKNINYTNKIKNTNNSFNKKLYVFSKLLQKDYKTLQKYNIDTQNYFFKTIEKEEGEEKEILLANKEKKIYIKVRENEIVANNNANDVAEQAAQMFKLALAQNYDVLNMHVETDNIEFKMHIKRLQQQHLQNILSRKNPQKSSQNPETSGI